MASAVLAAEIERIEMPGFDRFFGCIEPAYGCLIPVVSDTLFIKGEQYGRGDGSIWTRSSRWD
jgi:hypothetical protein